MEALAEQPDAQWLRDLGSQFRLDYGSRPLHTSGLDICHDYVGLRNLGNSCYLNSVAQCIYGRTPLREDIAGQSPPKGPLSSHLQRLFQLLSGEDGRWDYVSPAALLHQVLLTDSATFQYGDSADAAECCSMLLHSCLTRPALFMEPQAQYTVTGFIWHGNDHYVAYLVHGQQWYCLNHAVMMPFMSRKRARSVPEDPEEEDERAGCEARARQDTAFSAASWSSNMDGSRADKINNEDNPFQRFRHAFSLTLPQEHQKLREWPEQPVLLGAQPCLLCSGADFASRGELLAHIDAQHGGLQRYRNAFLRMESLCSHVVTGSEVRHYVGNYAEFLRSSAMDWDQQKPAQPRERLGCAFFSSALHKCGLHLAGPKCFMKKPAAVWAMLSVERYHERWPLIPLEELEASAVQMSPSTEAKLVLLHKRRLGPAIISGQSPAAVCSECADAFSPSRPRMCKYALANDLWLGRPDPLLRDANMTHEMCLALARTVATKVVLRAGGAAQQEPISGQRWDHMFQQSGLVGSAVVFHNGDAEHALQSLPPQKLSDALAITFCTDLPAEDLQEQGRNAVRRVVQLQLCRINRQLLSEWLQQEESAVPPLVSDCVVTAAQSLQDTQLKQEMEETCVLALEPQVQDFNEQGKEASLAIVSLLQKLEQLEQAGARSVALEMESVVDEQRTLVDYLGRAKILQLCREVHETCKQLSGPEQRSRLEMELRDAVMGKSRWLHRADEAQEADAQADSAASPHLLLARGKKPLSLWDWKIWTMAKPRLWRYGDAGNLYEREASLSTSEWAACLLLREELEYAVPAVADTSSVSVSREPAWRGEEQVVDYKTPVHNRFSGDWVALHMFATVTRLTEQRAASYNFLRNGGMAFAKSIEKLTAEDLAMAARNMSRSGGIEQFVKQSTAPQSVRDALLAMHCATATVVGSDGHRRLCRHEGVAYMETFGPPLIFVTPNVADTQHPLLLVVQGEALSLGEVTADMRGVLPKYREMLRRIAQDPVAQTVQFDLLMRLFFQHVLNVRPETLQCGRGSARTFAREWCSDGAAASSTGAGMLGPVLHFAEKSKLRAEVLNDLACWLRHQKATLQNRLRDFMFMAVASFESVCQSSVQAAPRVVGDLTLGKPVPVSSVAQQLCKFDGGSELCLLRDMESLTQEQQDVLDSAMKSSGAGHVWKLNLPDLHNLSSSLLKHMCSDSCFKYSEAGSPSFKICRHGFYHVVYVCEGCRCRRKGKALRPSVHVCSEAEAEFGMSGRLRPIQLTPFEAQTNYGGIVAGRQNLDAQAFACIVRVFERRRKRLC
ncbi:unnamed protein product [Effrenium voratum]|nr:unnamed protein product [Effrenium voratum]